MPPSPVPPVRPRRPSLDLRRRRSRPLLLPFSPSLDLEPLVLVPESRDQRARDLGAALGAGRVPLEPVAYAVRVEEVAAGKGHHLLGGAVFWFLVFWFLFLREEIKQKKRSE